MIIYVWGTGRLTALVVGNYISIEDVSGFIDNDTQKKEYMGKPVYQPQELKGFKFDAIVVATLYSLDIYQQCIELGLDLSRIIFLYNHCTLKDMNKDYEFIEKIFGEEFAKRIKKQHHIICEPLTKEKQCFSDTALEKSGYMKDDFVRIKCFEFVVKEIRKRNLRGAVAEVGVFRGEFAQYISFAFPDTKCYLFDTFEGFYLPEALDEQKKGHCTSAFIEAYRQTAVDKVLARLASSPNVVIKKGLFPESLEGLEDVFVFVSIDVDFENSIYEALKYFYPRLVKGGYIFVHDYNSELLGVEKAVDLYEREQEASLSKVPLCDKSGTLVITK